MTIEDFFQQPPRSKVIYYGAAPTSAESKRFSERGYTLIRYDSFDFSNVDELINVDSVVYSLDEEKSGEIKDLILQHATILLDYDCRIYIRPRTSAKKSGRMIVGIALLAAQLPASFDAKEREKIEKKLLEREGLPFAPFIYICNQQNQGWGKIARLIAENPPSRQQPISSLQITALDSQGKLIKFEDSEVALLRRSFWDCSELHLQRMADGISGSLVFKVHATLTAGTVGRIPFTCFLKIDHRPVIAGEYQKYLHQFMYYVPFYLAPRLILKRCVLGATKGILVGDLVEDAISLRDCASSGFAVAAISNLFNKTLRRWHQMSSVTERSIPDCLIDPAQGIDFFPKETDLPSERAAWISKLGCNFSFSELKEDFLKCDWKPVRVGSIHGDLHATNVLVRLSDAVLIDLDKVAEGLPILYDVASLEGGLLVEAFVKDSRSAEECIDSVRPLYEKGVSLGWEESCHPREPSQWFYDCVRQIRIHAHQFECHPGQYAAVLALVLLRKGCNDYPFESKGEEGLKRGHLRAGAYVLGADILKWLVKRKEGSEK